MKIKLDPLEKEYNCEIVAQFNAQDDSNGSYDVTVNVERTTTADFPLKRN